MKNSTDLQKDINKLNDEYIILLKERIKELEAQNQILIEALKK
tara:strand:- start:21 stop:149 length:129 start_codon:yes stop_codon:yes gene_type:complete